MMKFQKALLPLAVAMAIAGCGSRGTAQNVIAQSEAAVDGVRDTASTHAPEQLKAAEATVAEMNANFKEHEYKEVIADVPKINEQIVAINNAVAQGQTAATAATSEWTTLNTEVPKSVELIQARVDSLKPGKLPKDVTKQELETAKADLVTLKASWAEATTVAQTGDAVAATEKGRAVQAKAEELKSSLGITEAVAGNTPAAPAPASEPAPRAERTPPAAPPVARPAPAPAPAEPTSEPTPSEPVTASGPPASTAPSGTPQPESDESTNVPAAEDPATAPGSAEPEPTEPGTPGTPPPVTTPQP
jgi:hypothetical protein